LDAKLVVYVDKVKVMDAKEKFQSFPYGKRVKRLEVNKEILLVCNWIHLLEVKSTTLDS